MSLLAAWERAEVRVTAKGPGTRCASPSSPIEAWPLALELRRYAGFFKSRVGIDPRYGFPSPMIDA